jgi:hypothetical protein
MGIPIKNATNKIIRTVRGDIKIIAMGGAPMVMGWPELSE